MTTQELRMMMLSIDGVLSQYSATPTDLLAVAQAIATSAIGDLVNKSAVRADALHRFADLAADQIRAALTTRATTPATETTAAVVTMKRVIRTNPSPPLS